MPKKREGRASGRTVDIKALKESVALSMRDRGDFIVAVDDTFGVAMVYAYGTFKEYNELRERLFEDTDKVRQAYGYCSHGVAKSVPCPCTLVWANSKIPKEQAIPTIMHEISHAVDFILEDACIDDRSGEARAYLIQRESKRVLGGLFGIRSYDTVTERQIMEVLK